MRTQTFYLTPSTDFWVRITNNCNLFEVETFEGHLLCFDDWSQVLEYLDYNFNGDFPVQAATNYFFGRGLESGDPLAKMLAEFEANTRTGEFSVAQWYRMTQQPKVFLN